MVFNYNGIWYRCEYVRYDIYIYIVVYDIDGIINWYSIISTVSLVGIILEYVRIIVGIISI
jgi:hypothetical protein